MSYIPAQIIYGQSFSKASYFRKDSLLRHSFNTLPTITFAGACPHTKSKDLLKSQFGSSREARQYHWYGRGNVRKKSEGIAS
jgi:hypothetical protein